MSNPEKGYRNATDEALVDAAQADPGSSSSRSAASELLGRYQSAVYVWCFRYVKDHERALDLTQDVLLSAYRGLGSFAGRARVSSWLFSITRNRCLNEVRRVHLLVDEESDPDTIPDGHPSPEIDLEDQENQERILTLISDTLEPLEQQAIWLRCFERVSVDEITRLLEIESGSGARGLLQTARRKLRAALRMTRQKGEEEQ